MPLQTIADPSDLPRSLDVAVIGSGVVGMSTAFFAARAGLKVALLERMRAPASLATRRSGEGVRAQWELPQNIAIARESIALYREFAELLGIEASAGYRPVGYVYASRTEHGARTLAARVERQRAAGLDDVEYLTGDALHGRAPLLAPDATGAAFRAGDGLVDIDAILDGYRRATNGHLLLETEVRTFRLSSGGVAIETNRGRISAGAVVFAAGARSGALLSGLPGAPPFRTARSSILRARVEGVPTDHPATIDVDLGSFWRPDEHGLRVTASFAGMLFVDDDVEEPVPEAGYLDRAIETAAPLTPAWREWAARIRDSHVRTGTLAVTADGAPVIGPVPGAPGLYVNAGYGGHGIMMSPSGSRRVAALLAGGRHDPNDPFAVERFHHGRALPPEPMTIHIPGHG